MKQKNLVIFAHGAMRLNDAKYVDEFTNNNMNVLTFAPPTGACVYSPILLNHLLQKLHELNPTIGNFNDFFETVMKAEHEIRGDNYCSKTDAIRIRKHMNFAPDNGCGAQSGTIQNKIFQFFTEDSIAAVERIIGIWDLETNQNVFSDKLLQQLKAGKVTMKFSDVNQLLKRLYGENTEFNILDCSCSSTFDENGKKIIDARLMRRLRRHLKKMHTSSMSQKKSSTGSQKKSSSGSQNKSSTGSQKKSSASKSKTQKNQPKSPN